MNDVVMINGEPRSLAAGATLDAVIAQVAGSTRGSAAVVDGEVVPRSAWPTTTVRAGQRLEIITAVQGG